MKKNRVEEVFKKMVFLNDDNKYKFYRYCYST